MDSVGGTSVLLSHATQKLGDPASQVAPGGPNRGGATQESFYLSGIMYSNQSCECLWNVAFWVRCILVIRLYRTLWKGTEVRLDSFWIRCADWRKWACLKTLSKGSCSKWMWLAWDSSSDWLFYKEVSNMDKNPSSTWKNSGAGQTYYLFVLFYLLVYFMN